LLDEFRTGATECLDRPSRPAGPAAATAGRRPPASARRRRRLGLIIAAVLLGAGWLVATGLLARMELGRVAAAATRLRAGLASGDVGTARAATADLSVHAGRARRLVSGPLWSTAAGVPLLGSPLHSFRVLVGAVDDLDRHALAPLVNAAAGLDPDRIRLPDGRFDTDRIAALAPSIHAAAGHLKAAMVAVRGLPGSSWFPPIDGARDRLLARLTTSMRSLEGAEAAALVLPNMLGAQGERTYLLVFQNESEARGTGGLPGAFAVLHARGGRISFEHLDSQRVLQGVEVHPNLGADYEDLYGAAATTTLYGNANLGPHFPYAAQIWSAMWQRHFNRHLDGVLALDPTVLAHLLRVTGGTALADGTRITADNVVSLTEQIAYSRFPGLDGEPDRARREFLAAIEQAVAGRLLSARIGRPLLAALGDSVQERRVLVWSANAAEEAELMRTAVAGAVPVTSDPYVGLSIVNEGGNKLDYYLDRSLVWNRTGCGKQRQVAVTITLTNNAPGTGLPELVTLRSDRHAYPTAPGDNRLTVTYLATAGAQLQSVTLDGEQAMVGSAKLLGHPVFNFDVELPHGSTRTLSLRMTEPADSASPIVMRQPGVRPLAVQVFDQRC